MRRFQWYKSGAIAGLAVVIGLTGCIPEDPDPRDDLGEEGVKPAGVSELISDEELDDLVDRGAQVFWGDEPPSVEGTYLATGSEITLEEEYPHMVGRSIVNALVTIEALEDDEIWIERQEEDGQFVEGLGGYVSGHGQCFTLFVDSVQTREIEGDDDPEPCTLTQFELYSGCIVDGDYHYFHNSAVVTEHVEGDCEGNVREPGYLRIIESDVPARAQ